MQVELRLDSTNPGDMAVLRNIFGGTPVAGTLELRVDPAPTKVDAKATPTKKADPPKADPPKEETPKPEEPKTETPKRVTVEDIRKLGATKDGKSVKGIVDEYGGLSKVKEEQYAELYAKIAELPNK